MSVRRSRFEIYANILSVVRSGISQPTRIMYTTNLSWLPLNQILAQLVSQGLLEEYKDEGKDNRTKVTYRITPKGARAHKYHCFRHTQRPISRC